MNKRNISGQRQMDFVSKFDFIREAGTDAEKKAAALIREELSSFGMDSHLEEFPFYTWEIRKAAFAVTEPYYKEYQAEGYIRCGNTSEEGIEADFVYAENGDEISLSHVRGKIVMVNEIVRKDMYLKLLKAGAAGFVSITGTPVDEGEDRMPKATGIPQKLFDSLNERELIQGVGIHYLDALEIVTKGASRARLTLLQKEVSRTSGNIVARIPGTDRAEEILTLTAHYDSVPQGPGAYDNMAGAAIIMEICRYFKEHQPRRTLEFIWFGAEEKGLLGSRDYIKVHESELDAHRFNMNVDLAGQLVGGNVIGVTGDSSICSMLTYLARETGIGMTTKNQIWGSDSNTFAWKGIPAMTLNRDGFGMHTHYDTVELLSAWSLERSAQLLCHIAESLAAIDSMPFPQEIPEEFKKQLDEYFGA
ncbi:M20/M25/M40 family metallo-hydrolase [uncultured Blautia sp.]|uniref:M20/M25/M40 family metallo-hydrolase n=1 Tax=uncultured Blautia sp. TaxID=765821 RepID=UPI00280A523A|nr:M20/M25/M40 family metallo-hydrolase [uncultured Blautia sp.]